MAPHRRPVVKNPPYFSQEFFIQNYGDLLASVALVIAVGMMFRPTYPVSSTFLVMSHNVTVDSQTRLPVNQEEAEALTELDETRIVNLFTSGLKDLAVVFFYTLICLVVHQVWQEYLLDRMCRRLHLSKARTSMFSESGQMVLFSAMTVGWGVYIFWAHIVPTALRISSSSPSSSSGGGGQLSAVVSVLWDNYPHHYMAVGVKTYFLFQIAYWLHTMCEFYFQRLRSDEMRSQLRYIIPHLVLTGAAYVLRLNRLAVVLIVLNYLTFGMRHLNRLFALKSADTDIDPTRMVAKNPINGDWMTRTFYRLYVILFPICRLTSICLSVVVLWTGMGQVVVGLNEPSSAAAKDLLPTLSVLSFPIRIGCLLDICLIELFQMWNYIREMIHYMKLAKRPNHGGSSSTYSSSSESSSGNRLSQVERAKLRREAQRAQKALNLKQQHDSDSGVTSSSSAENSPKNSKKLAAIQRGGGSSKANNAGKVGSGDKKRN